METVSIEDAKPGMVLASDVKNERGMVLLPKGDELNEKLIARLEKSGISSIHVHSEGGGLEEFDKRKEILDRRFLRVMDKPVMAELHSLLIEKLEKEYGVN